MKAGTASSKTLAGALGSHRPGEHIHNALSAWVDLGLIGFAAYSMLIACQLSTCCSCGDCTCVTRASRLAVLFIFLVALFCGHGQNTLLISCCRWRWAPTLVVSTRTSWRTASIPSTAWCHADLPLVETAQSCTRRGAARHYGACQFASSCWHRDAGLLRCTALLCGL